MSALDQILYRVTGDGRRIEKIVSSFARRAEDSRWLQTLDPWLRAGTDPCRGYLHFGDEQAVLLRWQAGSPGSPGAGFVHVLAGPAPVLTVERALQFPELTESLADTYPSGRLPRIIDVGSIPHGRQAALRTRSRAPAAAEVLTPVLSRVLAGDASITVPWTDPFLPEAVIYGLVAVLAALGDHRPLSFMTRTVGGCPELPGLAVSFVPQAPAVSFDEACLSAAIGLVKQYADAGPRELERILRGHGVLDLAGAADRIDRLLELWPAQRGSRPADGAAREETSVTCPICLHSLPDWDGLPLWRRDSRRGEYVRVEIPSWVSREQRAFMQRGCMVRCPAPVGGTAEHYLPADYGRYGPPVVIAFAGLAGSGKSHLLAAMVNEIEIGGLGNYGIETQPIDFDIHGEFLHERVFPFVREGKVLPPTAPDSVSFADIFLIAPEGGPLRPVALFDVAGGNLTDIAQTNNFLNVVNGIVFVMDPAQLDQRGLGDAAFNTVLDTVRGAGMLPDRVSAAIVLNKADLIRFEKPIARWLRSDSRRLDADEITRESADVYAYLASRGAQAMTRPYAECARATLHVASATGGRSFQVGENLVYPRGVYPRRVLRPLAALLAMTGVLGGEEAGRVGT